MNTKIDLTHTNSQVKCFDHEKLDVYRVAMEFVGLINEITNSFPRGNAYLIDQLLRAGISIPLNIAEGAGEYSQNEKIRFYRMAKRSATECASILDICQKYEIVEVDQYQKARGLLLRIVAMLTSLCKTLN